MMKKTCCLIFCFFVFAGCNWSNRPKYKRIALDNSLLWEISGNGLASPSYLFGTDHLIGGNFLDTLPYVMGKFKQCKAVATEADLDSEPLEYKSHIFLKHDSLSHLFTPDEFSEIDRTLTRFLPWPLLKFNRYKPVYVYDELSVFISAKTTSKTNHHLDKYFREEGRKMGYKILGLETVKFHDSLLYDAPLDKQKESLLYLVRHIDQVRKSRQKSFKLYHEQNLNGLEILANSNAEFTNERYDGFIRARNNNWLRELPAIMKQQPTFIAVGAAHLLWDCGLINQLRLKGYTVKAVTN
ncbi:TraB/GumN family protein [uncultured Mucilaginibacter sp.]|uniref:TraB/GumN family protein n=1 Tax=uncultured Mucilaginibacter sp. TaxID=797541 RepID=UPI0025E9DE81|nr:TraB/GumN family protein [uncultured Mucilaginibacter sp.]